MAIRKSVVIVRDDTGRFGLQMRDGARGIPNRLKWSLFGGCCEPDESALDGAVRELREELEIETSGSEFREVDTVHVTTGVVFHVFEYEKPLRWGHFALREGAGIGFFLKEEVFEIESSELVREVLRTYY